MKNKIFLALSICAVFIFFLETSLLWSQTLPSACTQLKDKHKIIAQELLANLYSYDCCDKNLAECLKEKPICPLVDRLTKNICDRISKGENNDKIVRWLSKRARSMLPQRKMAEFNLEFCPKIGEEEAPVVLVEYACGRCPFCAQITPFLYQEITKGKLKGKVKLYFKTFPIRNHLHSKEAGLSLITASRMGSFWSFLLFTYEHFDDFCVDNLPEWADKNGLNVDLFKLLLSDGETRQILVESKKEGIRNQVDATPAFFINGRRYIGELTPDELIDVLEEEFQRLTMPAGLKK